MGWIQVDLDGSRWIQVDIGGSRWIQMDLGGSGWIQVDLGGSRWIWVMGSARGSYLPSISTLWATIHPVGRNQRQYRLLYFSYNCRPRDCTHCGCPGISYGRMYPPSSLHPAPHSRLRSRWIIFPKPMQAGCRQKRSHNSIVNTYFSEIVFCQSFSIKSVDMMM